MFSIPSLGSEHVLVDKYSAVPDEHHVLNGLSPAEVKAFQLDHSIAVNAFSLSFYYIYSAAIEVDANNPFPSTPLWTWNFFLSSAIRR